MRKVLLTLILALVSCSARSMHDSYVKPTVHLSGTRMVRVDQPWVLSAFLYGDFPPGEMGIEVSAGSRDTAVPFARGIADVGVSRMYRYRLTFTHSFYFRMRYEHRDGLLGSGRLFRQLDASCDFDCPWDEWITVRVRVRELEITPDGSLVMGRNYAEREHRIRLDCYDCRAEVNNEIRGDRG